jgi:anti-sigma-K factor RskA
MRLDPRDVPVIADQYVLGLLDAADMGEVEAEMERNGALAAAIAASRDRFLPLDLTVEPAAVDPRLWDAIAARLPDAPAVSSNLPPTVKPSAVNDNSRDGWRATALAGMAASVILAAGLAWSLTRTAEPLVIAVLLNDKGEVQAVVEDFGNENASVRLLADYEVPPDKTIQVWTLPSKEMGPTSLGLLQGSHSALLQAPALPEPKDAQLYEITLEQAGGSPTGRPTGPILAKGFAKLPR